jgi:hypothetical protein
MAQTEYEYQNVLANQQEYRVHLDLGGTISISYVMDYESYVWISDHPAESTSSTEVHSL